MRGEEKRNVVESELRRRTEQAMDNLGTDITDLSLIAKRINEHLKSETGLYNEVDKAFDKNIGLMGISSNNLKKGLPKD